jgi:glutamate/tyrosine decarboxylase-like PLP-dependent enzyme
MVRYDEFLDEVLAKVKTYLAEDGSLASSCDSKSLARTSDLKLPLEGSDLSSILVDIDDYLQKCVKTNHPNFMNPLWGGLNIAALAGEIIATLTNTSMYTFELAPLASLIERSILERMCEMVGFSNGGGTLTTGGSNGNMLGMLCARSRGEPLSQRRGIDGTNLAVYVSAESHYSVEMSANVLGIGLDNVIKVGCDDDGRMRPDKLVEEIERSIAEGQRPICVIATSGTTVRGAFDPLVELSKICHKNEIWLHVDAAWGGSCLFSTEHAKLMAGVELADSVCWDAHKLMGVPLICSAFLIKDLSLLRKVCSHGDAAHYLFHDETESDDLGRLSLQCGRRNDALKLFFAWRERGDSGWAKMVDGYMELAGHLESLVVEDPQLELMSSRQWTNVCFRFKAEEEEDASELNTEIRERLMQKGNYMISRSNIGEDVILRPVIANPGVTKESLEGLVAEVIAHGEDARRGIPSA